MYELREDSSIETAAAYQNKTVTASLWDWGRNMIKLCNKNIYIYCMYEDRCILKQTVTAYLGLGE